MKKFSRREKNIFRLMGFVIAIALFLKVYDAYVLRKEKLQLEIDSKRDQIAAFMKELEGQDAQTYRDKSSGLDEELAVAQEKVLELPQETDASLLIRKTISERAENSGLTINSISPRRSKELTEGKPLRELRTYFGYDTDLESLLHFFESFNQQDYYLVIDSLNISARTRPSSTRRRSSSSIRERLPLNGNAVLATLYLPNAEASLSRYDKPNSNAAIGDEFPMDEEVQDPEFDDYPEEAPDPIDEEGLEETPKVSQLVPPKKGTPVLKESQPRYEPENGPSKPPQTDGQEEKSDPPPEEAENDRIDSETGNNADPAADVPKPEPELEPKPQPLTGTAKPGNKKKSGRFREPS